MTNMEAIELPCVKLLLTACMPTCATPKSVGLDLYSPTCVLIPVIGTMYPNSSLKCNL